ncbi:hypothetical protein 2 [Shahe arthropod virus 1]|uniref:hypothetical protein 2 n=1 Tax=Shahe arthropod virus 1 TaxID=1923409 RepID=UPI00090B1E93|nr:hypothetical protein 2 [Shahe arthropod virus 1]APG77361.1 hypothetical protein 2 [Shahe arthropod virus 1]APG77392.1 hypothetical protein 2 [Shahe arthropod virus 1]
MTAATSTPANSTGIQPPSSKLAGGSDPPNLLKIGIEKQTAAQSGAQRNAPDAAEPNSAVDRSIGITNFVDAEDTSLDFTHAQDTLATRLLAADDTECQDIRKVMERPVFLSNVEWNASHATGHLLYNTVTPNETLILSTIKMQKLQYNVFLKCDVVYRIVAAPMQLQAGRLWLCWEPYRNERGARKSSPAITAFSTLAGVEFDPCKPSPLELRVPYQSILSSYDLVTGQYGSGQMLLRVLSPLTSAASTQAMTVSITAWLENVQLRVPTQAEMANIAPLLPRDSSSKHLEYVHGEPQVFQSQVEDRNANKQYFSRAMTALSFVATALGRFPLLASVAKPVASFASAVGTTAAYFGFSKPPDCSAPQKIMNHNRVGFVNADGALPLVKLAHTSDNEIAQNERFFPNPIDEMDINYIVSNPSMVDAFSWSTTDAVGKLISVIPIHPGLCYITSGPGTYTSHTFAPTPLAYVASMFKYWAGSIKIRLEAVSTPFHAGRLVVAYFPDYDPFGTFTITEIGNNYSLVWDITDSTHVEFEVPYIGNEPFKQVFLDNQSNQILKNGETSGTDARDRIRQVSNGAIVVFVLNQLVAPASAASSISFMNWISGGKDIVFAEPVLGAYKPACPGTVRTDFTGKWYDGTTMTPVHYSVLPTRAQEGEEFEEWEVDEADDGKWRCDQKFQSAPTNLTSLGMDDNQKSTNQRGDENQFIPMHYIDRAERSKLAFGEVITNLRTLIRRPTPAYIMYPQNVTSAGAFTGYAPTSGNVLVVDPDYFGTADGVGDASLYGKQIAPARPGGTNWLTELSSALSYVSYLYAFARGSRVYGLSVTPSSVINGAAFSTLSDETSPTNDSGLGTFDMRVSLHNEMNTPPRQPYFRPDDTLLGYNFANTSSSTLSTTNFSYGFNSALSGNCAVVKSGEQGCALTVQVPPGSNLPYKLITEPTTTESGYISSYSKQAPRSRRFLEIRYRPFQSAYSGGTSNQAPKLWPFPLTIMEAGADDFSFGGLVPPPLITKVAKHNVFVNFSNGTRVLL